MTELILHLVGDYITQTHWMAVNKTKRHIPALAHSIVYSLPFLVIGSVNACVLIFASHFLVDRYGLARYIMFVKNKITDRSLKWRNASKTGYSNDVPEWLSVWLLIIADNTVHLIGNHAILMFF